MKKHDKGSCSCCQTFGGPSHTEEECKICGKEWTRSRGGSWDWEYQDCIECFIKERLEKLKLDKK